jgi:soluble lytic murein transglycosylase
MICLVLIFVSPLILGPSNSSAASIEEQRELYKKARKELRAGRIDSFNNIATQLQDYPLYPYLRYDYINRNLWKTKTEEVVKFFDDYSDLPIANDLRRSWLTFLAQRGRWQTFVDNYTPQSNEELQCKYLLGRVRINKEAYLLEDARTMWLSGNSRPTECDPAFELLYKSDLMTDELIWQRIRLAMAEGQTGLAKFLAKKLDNDSRQWVEQWVVMHSNPWAGTNKVKFKDEAIAREILVHGMYRLATKDIKKAMQRWPDVKSAYSFSEDQIFTVESRLAIRAVRYDHPDAVKILKQLDSAKIDEDLLHARISTALKINDWDLLLQWTEGEPANESVSQRWRYWHARALEETGDPAGAKPIYQELAKERDYFGFSAFDKLGMDYDLRHRNLPEDKKTWDKVRSNSAIQRSKELFYLEMFYSARREWQHNLKNLNKHEMQIAANIASEWGWHDRAILTLGRAKAYDDLELRFPLPFQKVLAEYADKRQLDPSWVYALTRAESAFIEDVRSPAGALGLMQVMPATGRETAKSIGVKNFETDHLKQHDKNIPIGTAYLKKMFERFDNNLILATAAYNAGPHNVNKWLPDNGCLEPDVWIAQIPFKETRKYVRRILYFSSIYDWRLEKDIKTVQNRMGLVLPRKGQQLAALSCTASSVSMN